MDKHDLVFDIIEHPEKYSAEQLSEITSDPEIKEIYRLLCETDSAIKANNKIDVDGEWNEFSKKHAAGRRYLKWFGSRAASIVAIVCTSIVAVAAGIAVSVTISGHKAEQIAEKETTDTSSVNAVSADTIAATTDRLGNDMTPVTFEDQPLETIMNYVAAIYGVEVKFDNTEAAALHLYYKLDPSLPLNEIVEQLNTFEQINIKQNGNTLTID